MDKLVYVGNSGTGYSSPAAAMRLAGDKAIAGIETVDCNGYSNALYAVVPAAAGEGPFADLSERDRRWLKQCRVDLVGDVPAACELLRQLREGA